VFCYWAAREDFAFLHTVAGWISFGAAAAFMAFATIAFFITLSMIGLGRELINLPVGFAAKYRSCQAAIDEFPSADK
jgi:hypothetical protein